MMTTRLGLAATLLAGLAGLGGAPAARAADPTHARPAGSVMSCPVEGMSWDRWTADIRYGAACRAVESRRVAAVTTTGDGPEIHYAPSDEPGARRAARSGGQVVGWHAGANRGPIYAHEEAFPGLATR